MPDPHFNATMGQLDDDPGCWKLQPTVNLKLIGVLLFLTILLGYSAQRNELTRLPGMLYDGVTETVGLKKQSEMGPTIRCFLSGLWPPVLSEETDLTRVENFAPQHLPPFCSIVRRPNREYDALQRKWVRGKLI